MKATVEFTSQKTIEAIERLRGKRSAAEFLQLCAEAGLKQALAAEKKAIDKPIRFASAKPEFKTLDVGAITAALKDKNPKHPVKIEVSRLVGEYTSRLHAHAKENGNRLPTSLKVATQVPIERVAFQITAEAINKAINAANQKAKASGTK